MFRRLALITVIVPFLTLSGCGDADSGGSVSGAFAGITYELPDNGGTSVSQTTDALSFETPGVDVRIAAGELTVNGESFGTLSDGDSLRVTPDGAVFVNDGRRPPQ